MDNNNELSLSLMGSSENLITWGAILARKGFTLGGIYMPTHCEALASVLLLGCPAYSSCQETAETGGILFLEDNYFNTLSQVEKQQILETKALEAVVFTHFDGTAQTDNAEEKAQNIGAEFVDSCLNNTAEIHGCELYYLQINGCLPSIGKDIVRVDEVCAGQPHEPIPTEDYPLSCSEVSFVLRPLRGVGCREENIGHILKTVLL